MSVAKTGDSVVFIPSMIAGADGGSSPWLVACWRVSSPAALIGQAKRREWPPTSWANHDGLSVAFSSLGIWWGWQSGFALRKAHESGRFAGWQNATPHISSLVYWNKRMAGSLPSQYYEPVVV